MSAVVGTWSDEDKVRIVEESFRSHRQGAATARRYGIWRSLLSILQRAYRDGTLGDPDLGGGFVPLVMAEAAPPPVGRSVPPSEDARIDIALPVGLVRDPSGAVLKDPNVAVQDRLSLVFQLF